MKEKPIVFLDRDGTINRDTGYVCSPDRLELLPNVAQALGLIARAGFRLIVLTNQSGIGRGLATTDEVKATNDALCQALLRADADADIEQVLFCPHHPVDHCRCRKPGTGLLRALGDLSPAILADSWCVGDRESDLLFGRAAGLLPAHVLLVLTGEGASELERMNKAGKEWRSCEDLAAAARLIVRETAL